MKIALTTCGIILFAITAFIGCTNNTADSTKAADSTQAKSDPKPPGKITAYYSVIEDKFIFVDRFVLYTTGQDVVGFYGSAAQGSSEYYLVGKLTGNEITGTKYSLFDSSTEKFTLKVSPKSISGLSNLEKTEVPVDTAAQFHTEEGVVKQNFDIYELPNRSSKILAKEYKFENKGFNIIEIGKMEKSNDKDYPYDIWYKIKNKDFEGWVFGIISIIK